MKVDTTSAPGRTVLHLTGRFDFHSHKTFRAAMDTALADNSREIQLDLERVEYLDSSALGMLLMSLDKAKAVNKTLALVNCHGNVKQVLDIANFGRLFQIS